MATSETTPKFTTYRVIFDISHLLTPNALRTASLKCGAISYLSHPFKLGSNDEEKCRLFINIPLSNQVGYRMFSLEICSGEKPDCKLDKIYHVVCSIWSDPTISCEAFLRIRPDILSNDTAFCFNFFDLETLMEKTNAEKIMKIMCDITLCPPLTEMSTIRNKGPFRKNKLIEHFSTMLFSENHCDVTLVVRGTKFRAHKAILSARCEYFAKLFQSDEQETDVINFPNDVGPNEIKELLRYLYTGMSENLEHISLSLLKVADMCGIQELKTECCELILANINAMNATDILQLGVKLKIPFLAYAATRFFKKNHRVMMDRPEYIDFLIQNINTRTVAKILSLSEKYNIAKMKAAAIEYILRNKEKVLDNKKYRQLYASQYMIILEVDNHIFHLRQKSVLKNRKRVRTRRRRLTS